MTPLTDDELGDLLSETFRGQERLADPERASAIAVAAPRRRSHVGRAVLGVAAAVALVVGGTTYGLTRGPSRGAPDAGPSSPTSSAPHTPLPPLPPRQTNAGNRAKARVAAMRLSLRLPVIPGARRSGPNATLVKQGLLASGPTDHTVTRSTWWTVPGADPEAVAQWYDEHAPRGFRAQGSVSSSTSSGPSQPTVTAYAADYAQPGADVLPPHGESADVETMAIPGGTVVRATAISVWNPARPLGSYVQDVRSIDVRIVVTHFGHRLVHHARSFAITDPARVLRVATVFDSLSGYPYYVIDCPVILEVTSYRIVFHTATGVVTARYDASDCSSGMTVARHGRQVGPNLGDPARLVPLLHR